MEKAWHLERLDEEGRVRERLRLDGPVTVGRGYACDVIADDPSLSAVHARLTPGPEGWLVEDLGSLNGIYGPGSSVRALSLRPGEDVPFQLGATVWRLRSGDFPVPPPVPLSAASQGRRPRGPTAALSAWGGLLALAWLLKHWGEYQETDPSRLAGGWIIAAVLLGLAGAAWSGVWSLATRLASGRPSLWAHAKISAVGGMAFMAGNTAVTALAFAWGGGDWLGWVWGVAVTGFLLRGHLLQGVVPSLRRATLAAFTAAAFFWGTLGAVNHFFDQRFSPEPRFDGTILPAWVRLASPSGPEAFVEGFLEAKEDADAAAVK